MLVMGHMLSVRTVSASRMAQNAFPVFLKRGITVKTTMAPAPVAVTTSPSTPSRGAAICPSPTLTTDSTTSSASPSVNSSDQCFMRAFGASVCDTTLPSYSENKWVRRWSAIAHLKGRPYHLHGGSKGRRYVDQLSVEMSRLAVGNIPSERIMVFSAVILQHSRMVKKGLIFAE